MIVDRLARFAVDNRARELAPPVVHGAKRALVDWYAATVAGSSTAAARRLREAVDFGVSNGRSHLVPDGAPATPPTAALVNATASHVIEMDDVFRDGIYHPGSPTVGAALAAAEHLGVSGAELLRSIAVGYELSCRMAAVIQPSHYTYWHTTGTVGTLGAAAAVSELLGLDADQFAHSLANATTTEAGLQQAFRTDSMGKPLHAGHAANAGLVAAFAASKGFTGARDILEGEAGFGAAMSDAPDWESAVAKLGSTWAVTEQTIKNHSCCGHTFAAVDAALELRAAGVSAAQVRDVLVETYGAALSVADIEEPRTEFEAKFSLRYTVAAALMVGSVRLASFSPRWLGDGELRALAHRVRTRAAPEFDEVFPRQRGARVTVCLNSGEERSSVRRTRHGDPDDPLTDDELAEKFEELVSPELDHDRAKRLSELLWAIDEYGDVSAAFAGLRDRG